jgi:transposase InsO family protein
MVPRPLPKPHTLKSNHLTPGNCVSADHYFSPVPGCLPHTFGKERVRYMCGSLFVDHASGKIFNFPQYSNNASKTIQCAQRLESMARDEGFRIKAYHLYNGIFAAANFQEHCKQQQQKLSFSGVGAKHQNGITEQNIKTEAQWVYDNMLHLATYWPAEAHKRYWPQAIDYAVWVFNHLPNSTSGILPNKLWSRVQHVDIELRCAHVFGCPVYVLGMSFQDGKKKPK